MAEVKFPSEIVELPSQGKFYPKESPLSSGKVEMKYPSAKSEDILTNQSYIEKGIVIDKFLQDLIVDKSIDYSQLLVGDKNALLVAARIMGYGKDYEFEYGGKKVTVDLTECPNKPLDPSIAEADSNEFPFELPASGINVTFKFLTHADDQMIEQELKGLKKIYKDSVPELSTRLKYTITSVSGESDKKVVREFVDNALLARDARALRKHISDIQPDIDLRFYPEDGPEEGVQIPIGISFLWVDAGV